MGFGDEVKKIETGIEAFAGKVEKYFLEGMKIIQEDVLPIVGAVAAVDPALPAPVATIINALPALMTTVEAAFPEPGSGPVKAAAVTGAVKAVCNTIQATSTGGEANWWGKIGPVVNNYINGGISVINKLKPGTVDTAKVSVPAGPNFGN